jgi:ABC-2 type transport system permease protein
MVLLPLFVTVFFTTLMDDGQPVNMPIGVVDLDNTSTTRKLTRMVDALQSTEVVGHYPSVDEARAAIQRNEIYGFVLFPRNLTSKMISGRQPRMSFYYTNTSLTAGALVYKEMKTMCSLASAGVGQAMMRAKGFTSEQMRAFLMPVSIDLHTIGNPWVSYNIFLCSMLLPGMMLLFIFLITVYTLGTELKFGTSKEWLATAGNNIVIALIGKMLPYTVIFFSVFSAIMFYIFGILMKRPDKSHRLFLFIKNRHQIIILCIEPLQKHGSQFFCCLFFRCFLGHLFFQDQFPDMMFKTSLIKNIILFLIHFY